MKKLVKFLGIIALMMGLSLIMALPTMWLWNWLMPNIFELVEIGFRQALGLNILAGIFFKSTGSNSSS